MNHADGTGIHATSAQDEARTNECSGDEGLRSQASFRLPYRPPVDFDALFGFLAVRAIPGVEQVDGWVYRRSWSINGRPVGIHVEARADVSALHVRADAMTQSEREDVLRRVRRLFDIERDVASIDAALAADPLFTDQVGRQPGIRVPGAFDGFETAVRAVLGQQVSVAAARTLAARLVARLANGEPSDIPCGQLFPTAQRLAEADLRDFGMPQSRCDTLVRLAASVARGDVDLEGGMSKADLIPTLRAIRGIGPWTAEYIAMRCLHDPDCFPVEDIVLRREIGEGAIAPLSRVRSRAQAWRPWRSYAVIRLWQRATQRAASRAESRNSGPEGSR